MNAISTCTPFSVSLIRTHDRCINLACLIINLWCMRIQTERIQPARSSPTFRRYLFPVLTLIRLTWRIRWASNNASRWQMGFNSVFKGLTREMCFKGRFCSFPLAFWRMLGLYSTYLRSGQDSFLSHSYKFIYAYIHTRESPRPDIL